MGKAQLGELERHGMYLSVPRGISMWPMIPDREGIVEIRKLDHPANRYDVVLYVRNGDQGVIHRVLHARGDHYIIAGDNCWQKEYVPKEKVAGIVVRFCRKGKWHEVTEPGYRIYVHLWTDLFFIRRPILFLRDLAKKVLRKLGVRRSK
jgi:hypothetical protein